MQLFKDTKFDFLGKKWPFIIFSLVLLAAGIGSLVVKGGPRYGIDFRGGALMYVKFMELPAIDKIRSALSARVPGEISVQRIVGTNEIMVGTELKDEKALDAARRQMIETLALNFGEQSGRLDFNNAGQQALIERLREPLLKQGAGASDEELQKAVAGMLAMRDGAPHSGLLTSFDQLSAVEGVTPAMIAALKQECYLAPFSIRSVEVVGPKIGAELREQALMATLLALGGMLVYVAFRFEWIYGVAAVLAVFHDTLITVGLFSLLDMEISLTVVAALLTLVGYSMNDTIVIFDRVRENLKLMRKESFPSLVNISINQTLSRTVLTSGLTFLTVLALFLFGGQVLRGFSFALVVGVVIGTYSTIFIASPILLFWQNLLEKRKRAAVLAPATADSRKSGAKSVR